ncbi:MFS transporter [Thermococcus sp. MAR1]|uniref:MFS transporter n=1 Tax=Thermococcus sp. MAR1 TaxID=1638263 RepID=UPI00143A924B|nr:MFS transporter [Thermococcus sp. MAR1]NJE10457.1 MFS transporter [Thermococcus sp. MAR1]
MNLLRKYRLLFVLMNTGFIGNLTVIYYLSKGITYGQIGLVSAVSALGFFLFEVPTGVVADKMSRKTSVIIGMALFSLGTVVLILLRNFPMLIAYAVVSSLGATFVSGSLQAWLFDNLKHLGLEGRYREVMRDVKTLTLVSSAFSIPIGAFLAQLYGFTLPLLLTLIMELGTLLVAISIPEYEFKKPEISYHLHVLHSARELLRDDLLPLILVSIAVSMSINQFRKFFEPYLGEMLARSLGTTLMGTLGLLGIAEVLIKTLPRLIGIRLGNEWSVRAYEIAPLAIPVFTALSVLFQNPIFAVVLGITAGVINAAFGFNVSVEFQHRIPSEKRATVLSLDMMFSAVVMAVFYALYGFVVDTFGLSEARLLFAVVLFGIGLAFKLASLGPLKKPLELRHLAE